VLFRSSYWNKNSLYGYPTNYGYKHPASFIESVKPIADSINKEYLNSAAGLDNERLVPAAVADMISTMTFGQNCVIFVKKTVEEMNYNGRGYRYSENIV
jgi:hypothetical protein